MDNLLYKFPCLSETKILKRDAIHEKLFDKKCDKRYLETSLQKFIIINKKMFEFLGLKIIIEGNNNDLSVKFISSNQIGAIPVKMPYNTMLRKDFQVVPRFTTNSDVFSELTQLLSILDYSIEPEYFENELLSTPYQLRPPLYSEAAKYIELFYKALKYSWQKFEVVNRNHTYPKSGTDWNKYVSLVSDPTKALIYPAHDNILSTNHREWQELRYVFDIARNIIVNPSVPPSIKLKYQSEISRLQTKVGSVISKSTNYINLHNIDPNCIKQLKQQANILLQKNSNSCTAWRIDIAALFEKYIQYILNRSTKGIANSVYSNSKITGKGNIPKWGLKYLEPDITIRTDKCIIMADVKYKSHYYAKNVESNILKETHRADLHQLLAYCSFEPQKSKIGLLIYPANKTSFETLEYVDKICGINNKIILCGIPFSVAKINNVEQEFKEMICKYIFY